MDIPDAKEGRKPFRFQTKWIAWFVAFDLVFVAIALWVVFGRERGDDRLVFLDDRRLRLGAEEICPIVVNPKDRMSDFPDTVWSGFVIAPLKARLSGRGDLKTATYRLGAVPSMPFSMVEILLRTMRSAGLERLELVDSQGQVPIVLREASPNRFQEAIFADHGRMADGGNERPFAWLVERSDTLWLVASGRERTLVRCIPPSRRGSDPASRSAVRDSLRRWIASASPDDTLDSMGIFVSPEQSFRGLLEIARLVGEVGGKTTWIGKRWRGVDSFLSDRLDSASLDSAWREDSLAGSRGALLCGLERLFFQKQGVGGVLALASRSAGGLMPIRLEDSIVVPPCEGECHDLEAFSHRDFPLPDMGKGRRLLLREVQLRGFSMKTWPIWWALYDNGMRTSVWTFEGGMVDGKVLTNYQVDKIRLLGADGFRIQVKGESYRNGSWAEKGVELDFVRKGNDLLLEAVGNRFGWFDGDVFTTEDSAPGGWNERRAENPPASLLRKCGYRDPRREGSPEFDWDRNLRTTRCITAWPGAKTTFRPAGEKSFIER